jgi:hypothetical protein
MFGGILGFKKFQVLSHAAVFFMMIVSTQQLLNE